LLFFPNSETQKHCFFYNLKSNFNTYLTSNHFMKKNYLSVAARQVMGATSTSGKEDVLHATKKQTWRLFLIAVIALFSFAFMQAQTTLISPTGDGGFENGVTLAANNWTAANSSIDSWNLGTTPVVSAGAGCAFISSTSGGSQTWTYSQINTIQHMYYDVTIPAGESIVDFSFKWKAGGEGSGASDWDNLKVFWGTIATVVPVANAPISSTFQISGTGAISGMYKLSSSAYNTSTIALTGIPGTTYRLVFSWKSDVSDIANPPAALDDISLISRAPVPANAPPITFSTTSITENGMTINWVDDSTNEANFRLYRSTDNVTFTQIGANITSTSIATTGTAYSSVQTGLSAGTIYYYRIVAILEAESIPLTGSATTLSGATYYWTGLTGGLWNTYSNWNTAADGTGTAPTAWATSDTHIIDGAGTTPGGALSIVVDRASFTIGQIFITSNTDVTLFSSATTTRTITISGGPGQDFILENGSSLNLNSNLTTSSAVAFAFAGSGNTGTIAGTCIASGSIANTINTTGGTGTLVTVTSTGNITSNLNSSSGGISGNATSLLFQNGSNWTHQNSTTVNYIPNATWEANATATLNGNTTGTGLTSSSLSLGNLLVNSTLSTATLSAFTSNVRTIQGNLTINSTGTGRFRATTSGVLTINGDLVVNAGIFDVGSSSSGGVVVKGTTTVAVGATLDVNFKTLVNEGNMVNNGAVLSSETTTTNSSINFLGTTVPQTLSGTGTFTGRISNLGVSNPAGLTISTPVLTQRVNLFTGAVTGSGNITIGTGLALAGVVQIGTANNTNSGGSFDAAPVFNLGTGNYTTLYSGETTARTTGFEVPPTRSVNTLVLNNANGLTIAGGTVEVLNGLTLTDGIVTSTLANHIIHGSAIAAGTLTGGSATSFISGPIVRTINDANAASNYILFPVGIAGAYTPIAIAPATTSASKFSAEAFNVNAGTVDPSIIGLSATSRFEALPVSGTFTDINVRLSDAGIVALNIPVQAPAAAGVYASAFGSTATFDAGPPVTLTSNFPVTSANYTGFLSYANSNACSGTPAPGNTIASATAICLGETVSLSLQNIPSGSGITYQWRSSTDGATYTDITGAIGFTYDATPVAATFYVCNVTCATGSVSGLSTPVQITFSNSVIATIPAALCGTGAATLDATPSAGAAINWYAAATGGAALASGNSFTTPSINATTTYFASAASASAGTIALGAGATASTSVGASFFPGFWGGAKTQYIIRASELTAAGFAAGAISSLGFEPTTAGQTYQGFSVSLGLTTNTVTTTTFISSGLSQVYLGMLADDGYLPVANAVNTLAFGTGTGSASVFNWDGTSNVVVSISWSRVPSASTAVSSSLKVDNVGFDAAAHRQRDGLTPAAMLAETIASSTSSNRPRFFINGQVLCESARVPVVATVTPPPALTLSASTAAICEGDATAAITVTSTVSDYDTYVIAPTTGVTGNQTSGWVFNPSASTTYTLTATQTSGSLCATTTTFDVTVNPLPSVMTIAPATAAVCTDAIQSLVVSGGTLSNVSILSENFNDTTNNWTTANNSTGNAPAAIAWTLRNNGFNSFSSNDASQFYLSDNDAGGSGSTANTALTSPSFSTLNFANVNVSFWHNFRALGVAKVEYSVNGGTSWITVQTFTSTTGAPTAFAQQNIALPAGALNQANVQVRFKYDTTGWEYHWALDNVSVTGTQNQLITWSPATNLFTDAAATVAYVANANATTVYFKSSTAGVNNYIATATSGANCSVTATTAITAVDCAIPYANLQFPGAATITNCESQTFYAKVYKAGVTEASGPDAGIQAWIGRNTANTDPATWSESSWQLATYTGQAGNDDEYQVTFGPSVAGTYFVASRFVFAPGTFVYGGFTSAGGGIWDGTTNVSAVLTVGDSPAPTAAAQSFCNAGTVADLVAAGAGLQWYAVATGGTALAGTTVLATGDYYVSQTVNGCESARASVSVTVNTTAAPTAAAQTICNAGTVADLVAAGAGLQWYAVATGGTALAGTTVLATGDYYVSQTVNGCESARASVSVTVNTTAAPTAAAQTICNAGTVADLVAAGAGLQWYAVATGGTALAGTTVLATGDYYVSQTVNGCESARVTVSITVTTVATPTGSPNQTILGSVASDVTIEDIVVTGAGIVWYATSADALAGTNPIAAGTQLVDGSTYYAVSVVGACRSAALAVTINVTLNLESFDLSALKYYPNPVLDVFTVRYSRNITAIEVYDLSGRKVIGNKTNTAIVSVNMSGLAASVYVVKVFSEDQTAEFKIVKI
jgi:hypothetical protein